jgi:hypothetical protein
VYGNNLEIAYLSDTMAVTVIGAQRELLSRKGVRSWVVLLVVFAIIAVGTTIAYTIYKAVKGGAKKLKSDQYA